jgi:hypothetical protein
MCRLFCKKGSGGGDGPINKKITSDSGGDGPISEKLTSTQEYTCYFSNFPDYKTPPFKISPQDGNENSFYYEGKLFTFNGKKYSSQRCNDMTTDLSQCKSHGGVESSTAVFSGNLSQLIITLDWVADNNKQREIIGTCSVVKPSDTSTESTKLDSSKNPF